MGRTVFPQADGIVGVNVNDPLAHQGCQPHGRTHVVGENQERGSVGYDPSVGGHSVGHRSHAVLPDAEVEVPSVEITGTDMALIVQNGQGRRSKVGRPADQIRHRAGDRVHNPARRFPGGDTPRRR